MSGAVTEGKRLMRAVQRHMQVMARGEPDPSEVGAARAALVEALADYSRWVGDRGAPEEFTIEPARRATVEDVGRSGDTYAVVQRFQLHGVPDLGSTTDDDLSCEFVDLLHDSLALSLEALEGRGFVVSNVSGQFGPTRGV